MSEPERNRDSYSGVEVRGSSVAALVCADVLARQGKPVRLVPDSLDSLGGSFRRVSVAGRLVEAGARLLELSYGGEEGGNPDPRRYVYGEHRPMMGLISTYITSLVAPVEAEILVSRPDGTSGPDFLLTSNLHWLRDALTEAERQAIEVETRTHLSVQSQADLASTGYRRASLRLHGRTFHELFIAPLLDAILGPGGDVPALHHRRVWLPLFRTEEIYDAVTVGSGRPVRRMHVGMGAAVESLVRRVSPLVGASLPSGRSSVVTDTRRRVVNDMSLRLVWVNAPGFYLGPTVVWYPGREAYRSTTIDGTICYELSGEATAGIAPDLLGDRTIRVPLAEIGQVDPEAGLVGLGSFNEQIAQGISAAAWRMR